MHSSKRDTAVAGRRTSRMKELTNRNYLEHINEKSGISILEFYSPSCTHCKKMEGALTKLEEPKVRKKLRTWLRETIDKVGITSIFVTHDQDEAIEIADEIIITNKGLIICMCCGSGDACRK